MNAISSLMMPRPPIGSAIVIANQRLPTSARTAEEVHELIATLALESRDGTTRAARAAGRRESPARCPLRAPGSCARAGAATDADFLYAASIPLPDAVSWDTDELPWRVWYQCRSAEASRSVRSRVRKVSRSGNPVDCGHCTESHTSFELDRADSTIRPRVDRSLRAFDVTR